MRVLLVNDLPPGPTGGAEVHVGRLRDALLDAGDEVELFHAEDAHRGLRRALDVWDPAARRRLASQVERFVPDVVHYHNVLNELSTSVVGLGPPSVLTVHDARLLGTRVGADHERSVLAPAVALRALKDRAARARLRRAVDATVAPSTELAAALVQAGFPHVHHVPGFATPVASGPPGHDVVFVGTLAPYKGPQLLLEAFTRIADRHPRARLRLVGDGPLRRQLGDVARAGGLDQRVCFHGSVDPEDVPAVLRQAALVAVPSLGVEGGGPTMAVIEAMACGRAVVVSDGPGVREGVDASVGSVVPAGDVTALATEIDRLLSDQALLDRLGTAARARAAADWSPRSAVERVHHVYRDVLDG